MQHSNAASAAAGKQRLLAKACMLKVSYIICMSEWDEGAGARFVCGPISSGGCSAEVSSWAGRGEGSSTG